LRTEKTAHDVVRELSIDRLAWVRWFTEALITPMTDAQLVHRAGGAGNHGIWVMGHIAATDEFFRSHFTGQPGDLDDRFMDLFGGGSEIQADSRVYPSRAHLVQAMSAARANLIRWWSSLSDTELDQPLEGELARFAPDVRSLPVTIAAHEMLHAGQVATCRASLGLPRVLR
jgi:hypothetical protein